MRATLPNRAYLADIERFLRLVEDDGKCDLTFELRDGLFSVHPIVLCMLAALAEDARSRGGKCLIAREVLNNSTRYLERMKLFEQMHVKTSISVKEHEAAGRFIPVTRIGNNRELNDFIVDFVPLLHASPQESESVKYVLFELVRNVLEHAASGGAYVAAQVIKSGRLLVAVADGGIGVRASISRSHRADTDRQAIALAFSPGVTGATPRYGGNESNGGAGLFFMKAMASLARHHMVMVTGDTAMKLLTQRSDSSVLIQPDLEQDRVRWIPLGYSFPGTAVGIDLTVAEAVEFSSLLKQVGQVYNIRINERKAESKRRFKARFV